MKTGFVDS